MSDLQWRMGFEEGYNAYIFYDSEETINEDPEFKDGFKAGVLEAKKQYSCVKGECTS